MPTQREPTKPQIKCGYDLNEIAKFKSNFGFCNII